MHLVVLKGIKKMNIEDLGKIMNEGLINGLKMGAFLTIKQPMFWIIILMLIVYGIVKNNSISY